MRKTTQVISGPARGALAHVRAQEWPARWTPDKRYCVTTHLQHVPYIGLIDDDGHSAHLFMRMLAANDGPSVCHYGDAETGIADLAEVLGNPKASWPDLLVVDLKSHSDANLDFVRRHHAGLRQKGVTLVVMVPLHDGARRKTYLEAGAAAVFFRQPELTAYRQELTAITNFWADNGRLDAVGM